MCCCVVVRHAETDSVAGAKNPLQELFKLVLKGCVEAFFASLSEDILKESISALMAFATQEVPGSRKKLGASFLFCLNLRQWSAPHL